MAELALRLRPAMLPLEKVAGRERLVWALYSIGVDVQVELAIWPGNASVSFAALVFLQSAKEPSSLIWPNAATRSQRVLCAAAMAFRSLRGCRSRVGTFGTGAISLSHLEELGERVC
ncbi:hypothetical protein LPB72_19890 [Hydrogenophaga crassostreae]|uniref:Uncharacterized protein n=1 Tax=Hydrogenophaga crassostreae TaxID=1763535 RepID=A0A167GT13_9BURK|nr:hypothetical protein LPB072_01630 [Hydrogenophaga crassostreae]OAD39841.1 hypothetical protein LPB72_19890 [Hydrogenophaga crassostreae]